MCVELYPSQFVICVLFFNKGLYPRVFDQNVVYQYAFLKQITPVFHILFLLQNIAMFISLALDFSVIHVVFTISRTSELLSSFSSLAISLLRSIPPPPHPQPLPVCPASSYPFVNFETDIFLVPYIRVTSIFAALSRESMLLIVPLIRCVSIVATVRVLIFFILVLFVLRFLSFRMQL